MRTLSISLLRYCFSGYITVSWRFLRSRDKDSRYRPNPARGGLCLYLFLDDVRFTGCVYHGVLTFSEVSRQDSRYRPNPARGGLCLYLFLDDVRFTGCDYHGVLTFSEVSRQKLQLSSKSRA
ncbi:hypothetical protein RRG08_023882 [Elysia crispata]|uniref:Uncharacterized protein n=1 Tax=Elysia crispata TaxID=231223 RepID=A0AAE1AUJ7_9GAST|nr:hypothetical protein RRG08_023882 [Elysia crispata]